MPDPHKKPSQGSHKKVKIQQDGFELTLDTQDQNVHEVFVRLGKQVDTDMYRWDRTIALGDTAIAPKQTTAVISIPNDQLPPAPGQTFYQFLLEVDGEHGYREMLLTDPAPLQ